MDVGKVSSSLEALIERKPIPSQVKRRILDSITRFLLLVREHFKDKLLSVIVFGSVVQPNRPFLDDSDIDFMVFYDGDRRMAWSFEDKLPTRTRIRIGALIDVNEFKFDEERKVYWHLVFFTSQESWKLVKMLNRVGDYVVVHGEDVIRKLISGKGE
ncbi:MAG: nucleotidyltransferase domain-containing protein [Candidatus Nezhaarchaeales archaeon]